jgi:hypothetical protein
VLHKLKVKTLYVKRRALEDGSDTFAALYRLMVYQGIDLRPTLGDFPFFEYEPGLPFDYDLDQAKNQPNRGTVHIIQNYLKEFRLPMLGWNEPFLNMDTWSANVNVKDATLWFLSPRWREKSRVDWKRVFDSVEGKKYFIGFDKDWDAFKKTVGPVQRIVTDDLMDMARLIRDARALYTNQSVALTIAQGLGKPYWLEVKPGKSNTLFYTRNEHVLL